MGVELYQRDGTVRLAVVVDGVRIDPDVLASRVAEGHRHRSHSVRLEMVGGRLDIVALPGGGTRAKANVPA